MTHRKKAVSLLMLPALEAELCEPPLFLARKSKSSALHRGNQTFLEGSINVNATPHPSIFQAHKCMAECING
jgi:hypothetical protein